MITELSQEQKNRFPEFVEKWTKIGLSTGRANRAIAEQACRDAYREGGLEEPKIILWAESPIGLLLTAKLVKEAAKQGIPPYSLAMYDIAVWNNVWSTVRNNVWSTVRDNVWANVSANVSANVWSTVRDNVWANVSANVGDTVWNNVWSNVWSTVRANVWANVWNNVGALREEYNQIASWGQHDANIWAFYDYFRTVCGMEICNRLDPLMRLSEQTGWHLFYRGVAILCERPTELHLNKEGRLHRDGGPCLRWYDGYEMFALNGIRVPAEIALLKEKDITKDAILQQQNADYRREIVRKLTPTRLIEVLQPKVLDEKFGYALLGINLGDERTRPFLKMVNPSIDAVHIEGVLPSCESVEDALEFRNDRPGYPITLDGYEHFTEALGDFYQQGDCLFSIEAELPEGAIRCGHNVAGEGLIRHMQVGGTLYELGAVRYLEVPERAVVEHPEHKPTVLSEGVYKITKVKEYDHWLEESREVID